MRCNKLRLAITAASLLSAYASARLALAAPTVFFARDEAIGAPTNSLAKYNHFIGTLHSYGVEDIEDDAGPFPSLEFGATGITATTQGVVGASAPGFQFGGQALLELEATDPNSATAISTVITFSEPITAFGIFVVQGGDFGNDNPTTFRLRNTSDSSFVDVPVQVGPGWGLTNVFFLGIADTDAFDEVEIIETGDLADGMLYDNIVAGFVPEPGSLLLMMLGGACALNRAGRCRRD